MRRKGRGFLGALSSLTLISLLLLQGLEKEGLKRESKDKLHSLGSRPDW
jgi:hypothetical protein